MYYMQGTKRKYNKNSKLHWWKIDLVKGMRIGPFRRKVIWVWARSYDKAMQLAKPHLPKPGYDYNGKYVCLGAEAFNCIDVRVPTRHSLSHGLKGVGKPKWYDFKVK